MSTPTPHNSATKGDIAEGVLLPGDPLRAKYIAENYLEDVVCYNSVRNMLGYTGTYKGKRVSIQGTGMGVPSVAIYSYELMHFYGCKRLIRIGTSGSYQEHTKIGDMVFAQAACTDTNFANQYEFKGTYAPIGSWDLLCKAAKSADEKGYRYEVGNVFTSEVFYHASPEAHKKWIEMGVLAIEMEAAALYMSAAAAKVDALAIVTVTDSMLTGEGATAKERETIFTNMAEVALDIV